MDSTSPPHSSSRPEPARPLPGRRDTLRWLGALGAGGALPLLGCGGGSEAGDSVYGSSSSSSSSMSSGTSSSSTASCSTTPTTTASEIAGPYPADGSNSNSGSVVDVLAMSGIVRSDIRSNLGASSVRTGVPLTLTLTLQDTSCRPYVGASVYVWHCDKDGVYSAYTASTNDGGTSHTSDTFLRGVQLSDANGQVMFTTIYPGWYSGRITHIHFEVYTDGNHVSGTPKLTSQLAFPQSVTQTVYSSTLYAAHGQNTSVTSFSADNIFSDGTSTEMLTLSGDTSSGYTATLTVTL